MENPVIGIALIFVLVAFTGFFVASEFALVSVRKTRIEQLISEGSRLAALVKSAIEHLPIYIAATQVGITLATLGLGAWGESALDALLVPPLEAIFPKDFIERFISYHGIAFIISFLIVTVLEIVLGELVPKIIARQRAEQAVLLVIRPLNFFALLFRPLIWLINKLAAVVLRALRLPPSRETDNVHSVEELEMLVSSSRQAGVLEAQEEAILKRVFDLGELNARQVMLPRTGMSSVPIEAALDDVIELVEREKHSRFPVYDGDLDHIVGVLHVKDLFLAMTRYLERNPDHSLMEWAPQFKVRSFMREILTVPETLQVSNLLAEMQRTGTHMAVVVDEYGGTAGIVTLEDVVEEIVGELHDEFESSEEHPDIVFTPDGTIVNGLLPVQDANEQLALHLESEADTIGGYVFEQLGRKPEVGDQVPAGDYVLLVEQLDGLRIAEVKVVPRAKAATPTMEDE